MAADQGPEPGGWELMRMLTALRGDVKELGGNVVSAQVYASDKQAADQRAARAEARLAELERSREAHSAAAAQAQAEKDKQNRQNRFLLTMAFVGPVAAIIATKLLEGVGIG